MHPTLLWPLSGLIFGLHCVQGHVKDRNGDDTSEMLGVRAYQGNWSDEETNGQVDRRNRHKRICSDHQELITNMLDQNHTDRRLTMKDVKRSDVLCPVRHLKSHKLALVRRKVENSTSCVRADVQAMKSAEAVESVRLDLELKHCLDPPTKKVIRKASQLLGEEDKWSRSKDRRLIRLLCQVFRVQSSCEQRRRIEDKAADDEMTSAEIYFLSHWPSADEIEDPNDLEMIFY